MSKTILSGSYREEDVMFLLKNINGLISEKNNEFRENAIQSGVHYSEMLPVEYHPSEEYMKIFYETLEQSKTKIAYLTALLSRRIIKSRGKNIVLVSLARAGTPIGILIRRYLKFKYELEIPHYSISIIRDKGIDTNALNCIIKQHPGKEIQFIDGWTGKGVIQKTLKEACDKFLLDYSIKLDSDLAVLSDPAFCTSIYATREDFLIPSACLNSTVSGLISRTVFNKSFISEEDFHGAKYYEEWKSLDVSNFFVDTITEEFEKINISADEEWDKSIVSSGLSDVNRIQKIYSIENVNLIKPGVGETTRVLLRRIPWKILVDSLSNPNLRHILKLAEDRNVPVEVFRDMSYSCCGIIKPKEKGDI